MTLTDVAEKVIHGWMIDKRISIPAIFAILSAVVATAIWANDIKSDIRANARESLFLRQELDDQKAFTRAIPMISERVGRLEATVAASSIRTEKSVDEIKELIIQTNKANRGQVIRRPLSPRP